MEDLSSLAHDDMQTKLSKTGDRIGRLPDLMVQLIGPVLKTEKPDDVIIELLLILIK